MDSRAAAPVTDASVSLLPRIERLWELSAKKIWSLERTWNPADGAPVLTVDGRYHTRGWTQWTEGFQYGSALLQFDATGDQAFLDLGRARTVDCMAGHLTHAGVHDHGFNNVSTYGTLWRLVRERRIDASPWEVQFYELALKASGAVQAGRWTPLDASSSPPFSLPPSFGEKATGRPPNVQSRERRGFIHSFNGRHSLFVDTIRSLRVLALSHRFGQQLLGEQDAAVDLLDRLLQHARATAEHNVYYGLGRDRYDVRGRVAHECMFNTASGTFRGPSTQQGYSPFSTWTRGLAWAMLGFAELLEFLATVSDEALAAEGGRAHIEGWMLEAACATCDFYVDHAAARDGVPYWDTGAPGLAALGDWRSRASDPFNDHEPVDSSAAAIAGQGLLRLARVMAARGRDGTRYSDAGLRVLETLLDEPYLSTAPTHQGLLLHAIYHRPNGWDYTPAGSGIPRGESCQWGDYHLRELALLVQRLAAAGPYLTFFGPVAE
jgi:unsaturated chondroitin disaccharide hydrolase